MAEPVGITGTALAVASVLYISCRTICDIIDSYQKAPKEYHDLLQYIKGIQGALNSLQTTLQGIDDSSLSPEQKTCLTDLQLPLNTCEAACQDFKAKLEKLTSHSTENHTAVQDRFRLHFNKSDITFFRQKLNAAKGTIKKTLVQNQKDLVEFQQTSAATMSEFSGRVEALALTVESLSVSGVCITQEDLEVVRRTLDEHGQMLRQCLIFHTSVLNAANSAAPGTRVKHAKALEHARQIIGNLGPLKADAQSVDVDTAEAAGNAFHSVGNTDLTGLSAEVLKVIMSAN